MNNLALTRFAGVDIRLLFALLADPKGAKSIHDMALTGKVSRRWRRYLEAFKKGNHGNTTAKGEKIMGLFDFLNGQAKKKDPFLENLLKEDKKVPKGGFTERQWMENAVKTQEHLKKKK
jgi:hypothetical protein